MPVIEKSARAWYVYDCLRDMDINSSKYTNQQLEHLYDASESLSKITGDVMWKCLKRIVQAINVS